MSEHEEATTAFSPRAAGWLSEHVGAAVLLTLLVSAVLAVPFLTMQPEGSASQEPAGEVFEARDLVNDRFVSAAFVIPLIVEARGGDLLQPEPLRELLANSAALREDPDVGPKLFSYFDRDLRVDVHGLHTLADAIEDALRAQGHGGVADADEATIKAVAGPIIDALGPGTLALSGQSHRDPDSGDWVVPALTVLVLGDDEAVGGPPAGVQLGIDDTTKEEFNREVQALLRGDEVHVQAWGVGIDVNLTSAEQGQAAGPFIGLTILAVLLVVGLTFRSYWPVALCGAALALMIVWLLGLANLVGMEQDQILATIVPIAMISFGIDFAFHSLGRYREERDKGRPPRQALTVGVAGVLGALVLALLSDSAAFLANTAAGIQSIVQFGIAAAFGLAAAFVMLGIITPAALMRIEEEVGQPPQQRLVKAASVGGSLLAAAATMGAVLLSVFLAPAVGLVLIGVYLVAFLVLPVLIGRRWQGSASPLPAQAHGPSHAAERIGAVVAAVARHRRTLVPAVIALTALCAVFAVQVPAQFDVKDFFSPSSNFVVSLDKLDEHAGAGGGEPAVFFIEGDLTAPASIEALDRFTRGLRALPAQGFGRDDDGAVLVSGGVLEILADAVASPATIATVERATGVAVADRDGDGYPDTADQIDAVFDVALADGVATDEQRLAWTPDDVGQVLWRSDDGRRDATRFDIFLTGTREQESIARTEDQLMPLVDRLEADLQAAAPDARAVLTGAPIARQHSLEAISRALQVSLPIAIVLCLLISAGVMRSLRYAAVSIVPIVLVVVWLYAFMYAFGFNLNIVTATIGAISIGIGIDYAIHFTMRYREESSPGRTPDQVLRIAGQSTGLALAASAFSSIIGFGILALAPMPLFASYGLLTAIMIVMALAASLLVLPSLLALVTPTPAPAGLVPQALADGLAPDGGTDPAAPTEAGPASIGDRQPANTAQRIALLNRVGVFQDSPPDLLRRLADMLAPVAVLPGQEVVRQGEPSGAIYIIDVGTVRVEAATGDRRYLVTRLGTGEFFGEISLLTGGPSTATVVADGPAQLLCLREHDVRRMMAEHPDLAQRVRRAAAMRQQGLAAQEHTVEHLNLAQLLEDRDQIVIGRAPDNDVVLDSVLVSSVHAVLRRSGDTFLIEDLRSTNGIYVNGAPVRRASLKDGDRLRIADQLFVFDRRDLSHVVEPRGIRIDAVGLQKVVREDKNLLAHVDLTILPGEFVAIVGGSGAGKSTLLDALSGVRPPTGGEVMYNGHDLLANRDRFTQSLGYVPQDDIIHLDLPVGLTIDYAARLRLPEDTTTDERQATVTRVIEALDLEGQRDIKVAQLSGGQRKRSSIAVELLTEPKVFFLDEPTSGLDPAADASMMRLLRRLAVDGSTVVLTTHATKNVTLCDRVVVLATGGHVAFAGTPADALDFFGVDEFDEIYDVLADREPAAWDAHFRSSDEHQRAQSAREQFVTDPDTGRAETAPHPRRRGFRRAAREFALLSARNVQTYLRSPPTLVPLIVQPVALTLLLIALFNADTFSLTDGRPTEAALMLFTFSFMAFTFGLLYGIQVIAREFAIFHRERLVGQGIVPYVLSKLGVLVPVMVVSVAFMLLTLRLTGRLGDRGLFPLFVTILLVSLAGLTLALFTSAFAATPTQATDLLSLWILPQVLFGGAIASVSSMNAVARFLSRLTVIRPGFEAAGDATEIVALFEAVGGPTGQSLLLQYEGFFTDYATNWAIMSVFVILPLVGACLVLWRRTRLS